MVDANQNQPIPALQVLVGADHSGCSPRLSDPAMKQFLLYLDDTNVLGKKFIIQDLDETHLFVLAEVVHILQEKVGDLMDQNSFPLTQK
ncbi:general transcription factor IIH subunit 5 isoform X1 [Leucoraja erinacea]|uniref:general transcription factor IIH subunit 5 isoform X1 n=1 Tax=Leucoraja erinaceus TaxID=7782 RepID=UPI00245657BB|nr:general transcription factor IIH subunit 5 isoform X1 [Leucoraja erinacea]